MSDQFFDLSPFLGPFRHNGWTTNTQVLMSLVRPLGPPLNLAIF